MRTSVSIRTKQWNISNNQTCASAGFGVASEQYSFGRERITSFSRSFMLLMLLNISAQKSKVFGFSSFLAVWDKTKQDTNLGMIIVRWTMTAVFFHVGIVRISIIIRWVISWSINTSNIFFFLLSKFFCTPKRNLYRLKLSTFYSSLYTVPNWTQLY